MSANIQGTHERTPMHDDAPVPRGSENGNRFSPTGTSMLTHTGRLVELSQLDPDDVRIDEIAFNLEGVIRFGGAHPRRINVAQHSLAVEHIAGVLAHDTDALNVRRAALLHDAAEAYIGDLTGAVKKLLRGFSVPLPYGCDFGQSPFDALEDRIQAVINTKYGIDTSRAVRQIVHDADCIACAYEMELDDWSPGGTNCPQWARDSIALRIIYMEHAEARFWMRARGLGLT